MTQELKTKLEAYLEKLAEANKYYLFTYSVGKKYIRIIRDWNGCGHFSVFCFMDYEGNLYKAESWERPAKGIRGHIDHPYLNEGQFYR